MTKFTSQTDLENSLYHNKFIAQNVENYNTTILKVYYDKLLELIKNEKKSYKTTKLLAGAKLEDITSMSLCYVLSTCIRPPDSEIIFNTLSFNLGDYLFPDFEKDGKIQTGAMILGHMIDIGFLNERHFYKSNCTTIILNLHQDILDIVERIDKRIMTFSTHAVPCIEPPYEWVNFYDGGFHTDEFRKKFGCFIKCPFAFGKQREYISKLNKVHFKCVFSAINTLQRTKWKVNKNVLKNVEKLAKNTKIGEIFTEKPEKMTFFEGKNREKFLQYEKYKQDYSKYLKYHSLMKSAEEFAEYPELYFVYKCDFRGRVYAISRDLNPQGSDLCKALLQFKNGCKLETPDALKWFLINGANRFGYDKVSFDDRVKWVRDNNDTILSYATNPCENLSWHNASKPFQFLAWCLEYKEWYDSPDTFESHLPVSLDGTANGLQHLTALLFDDKAAPLVNLGNSDKPSDIYTHISKMVYSAVLNDEDSYMRKLWLENKIERNVVKRCVMTMPYGVTRYSMTDFILKDYLQVVENTIPPENYIAASQYLSEKIYKILDAEIPSANSIMNWFKKQAREILKNDNYIEWFAPSGFQVIQDYRKQKRKRYRIKKFGNLISFLEFTGDNDIKRHCSGISPNFIHSLDASHMVFTINAGHEFGIDDFIMIHDDYGVLPVYCERFHQIIREEFYHIYREFNPLSDFYRRYSCVTMPTFKQYDISNVLKSEYLFN